MKGALVYNGTYYVCEVTDVAYHDDQGLNPVVIKATSKTTAPKVKVATDKVIRLNKKKSLVDLIDTDNNDHITKDEVRLYEESLKS